MIYKIKESQELRLNLLYITIQGLYWMIVCCTISLGSAYLSNRGYSTVGIGALFAIAYLIASVLQQVISVETDKSSRFNVVDVLAVLGANRQSTAGWRGSLGVSQCWVRSGRHMSLAEADRGGQAAGAAAHP